MPENQGPIEQFVSRVRHRLNRHQLWTTLVWTIVAGAGLVSLIALYYVLQGYAVPGAAIIASTSVAVIGGLLAWRLRRLSVDSAAQASDKFYSLQDAIGSYLHFTRSGKQGGYYALQADQTRERVQPLDPASMKYDAPKRGIALAACLVAVAVPLSLRGPSAAVLQQEQIELQTKEATAVINKSLAKTVEELRKETGDPNEKELLDPNKLRKWVDELKDTKDQKEALRQYAELERKLNEARLSVQNKRDEQLLERAARELETTRETQPLADELKQKNYDKAAEQMGKMAPEEKGQPLDKQRQELARLKAIAQHMAAAARASQSGAKEAKSSASTAKDAKSQSASANSKSGNSAGSSGGAEGAASEGSGGEMAQSMEDLEKSVSNLDKSLEDAIRQEKRDGQCDSKKLGECQACKQSVAQQLSKLTDQMKKLGVCKKCESKLCKLCTMCSQCQGGLCESAAMCMGQKPGGKKPGKGTVESRRSEQDELVDNGQTQQLKGIKGTGESLTTVEAAESGSGTSNRKGEARQRAFQRQYESFVAREDVPEQVKSGVKRYFEVIHELQPEQPKKGTP